MFIKVLDLNLWEQNLNGDELVGKDNTKIYQILEMTKGVHFHKKIIKVEDCPDREEHKPFYQTVQKKLAFMNQSHVVKHLHVDYDQDKDDEENDEYARANSGNTS
jgi:hypothetical protein